MEFRLWATTPAWLCLHFLHLRKLLHFLHLRKLLLPRRHRLSIAWEAFALLRMSRPAMPAPVSPEGVFGPMPVGGAIIGGDVAPQTPPSFPILATPIAAIRPPIQWNYPIYEGKGEDMLLQMSKGIGKGRLPAYEREYPLPKPPSVPPLPQLRVNLPMPPPPPEEYTGVPTTPPMPRPAGIESPPPPPSPDAMSEASDSAVLERGF